MVVECPPDVVPAVPRPGAGWFKLTRCGFAGAERLRFKSEYRIKVLFYDVDKKSARADNSEEVNSEEDIRVRLRLLRDILVRCSDSRLNIRVLDRNLHTQSTGH